MSGARTVQYGKGRQDALRRLAAAAAYPETLSITELGAVIDYTQRAIGRWISEGLITVDRHRHNLVRIPVKGLDFLPPFGELLITAQTARSMLKSTQSHLDYETRCGRIRAIKMPGGQRRYFMSQIRDIAASKKGNAQ